MGMFDTYFIESKCPNCGHEITEWQGKDLECLFTEYKLGDTISKAFDNLKYVRVYARCRPPGFKLINLQEGTVTYPGMKKEDIWGCGEELDAVIRIENHRLVSFKQLVDDDVIAFKEDLPDRIGLDHLQESKHERLGYSTKNAIEIRIGGLWIHIPEWLNIEVTGVERVQEDYPMSFLVIRQEDGRYLLGCRNYNSKLYLEIYHELFA
ncbi:MAG: hypothetical protein INQ03_09195 [Candidatus Heimdallarchaeota archaeon]|nr:hypothetical protein [Candidatus Heimdallarchaeota archaeon]